MVSSIGAFLLAHQRKHRATMYGMNHRVMTYGMYPEKRQKTSLSIVAHHARPSHPAHLRQPLPRLPCPSPFRKFLPRAARTRRNWRHFDPQVLSWCYSVCFATTGRDGLRRNGGGGGGIQTPCVRFTVGRPRRRTVAFAVRHMTLHVLLFLV